MFAVLPIGMNYRTERLPIVTFSIIGLNTLVYLVSLVCALNTGGKSTWWVMQHLWLIPNQSFWWTYLTSMFVHAGFFHLAGNMIYLFLFGCCVEDLIGRVRFTVFYLVSGIIAALAFIAFSPEHFASGVSLGGASGAISACMGMYLLLRADADIEFKYFYWLFFIAFGSGEFELPAWIAISFWFLKDLFWMVLGMYFHHLGGGVAFGAHVGGLLAGLALVGIYKLVVRPVELVTKTPEPVVARPIRIVTTEPRKTAIRYHVAESTPPPGNTPKAPTAAAAAPEIPPTEIPTIFLHMAGEQSGPFTLSQVLAMTKLGSVGQDALYWSEGLTEWQSVSDLSGV